MIHYLCTARDPRVFEEYLESDGLAVAPMIRTRTYDEVLASDFVPAGTYVFADIECLSPERAQWLARVWRELERSGSRLLNHPTRSLHRYELLRRLHEQGSNAFDLQRLTEARAPRRWPVFLRDLVHHTGNLTPLLHDPVELEKALETLLGEECYSREALAVVEFCDTADSAGIYRKFSAFHVGGRVIPRHVFFAHDWMLKWPVLLEPELLEEERHYVEENPHESEIRRIFELAQIDYGRIDYSMLDGQMQVWEINTHPFVSTPGVVGRDLRGGILESFLPSYESALRALDSPQPGPAKVPIPRLTPPLGVLERVAWRVRRELARTVRKLLGRPKQRRWS